MKILLAHNRYQQRGGEDTVYEQERDLLKAHGNEVVEYLKDNRELGGLSKFKLATTALWSSDAYAELIKLEEQRRTGKVDPVRHQSRKTLLVAQLERIYGELDDQGPVSGGDEGLAA